MGHLIGKSVDVTSTDVKPREISGPFRQIENRWSRAQVWLQFSLLHVKEGAGERRVILSPYDHTQPRHDPTGLGINFRKKEWLTLTLLLPNSPPSRCSMSTVLSRSKMTNRSFEKTIRFRLFPMPPTTPKRRRRNTSRSMEHYFPWLPNLMCV
jgi:hypothetical protein